MSWLVGEVLGIYYENATDYYKVMEVSIDETDLEREEASIVVVGNFAHIEAGDIYRFEGYLTTHAKYGEQFKCEQYQKEKPSSEASIIQYLSSPQFPGIGKKTAENIVKTLGLAAIDQINEDPDVLLDVKGLNEAKREVVRKGIQENYGMEQIIIRLQSYGFSNQMAYNIFSEYKEDTLNIIEENPYKLVIDVKGVGFSQADRVAEALDFSVLDDHRIQAALYFVLSDYCFRTGDTYWGQAPFIQETKDTLERSRAGEISETLIEENIKALVGVKTLYREDDHIFLGYLYEAETDIVREIQRLIHGQVSTFSDTKIEQKLNDVAQKNGVSYDDVQCRAVKQALQSPFFVLTGGPGTGKTTIIRAIVSVYAALHHYSLNPKDYSDDEPFPIHLAAPTGRAAKRMSEMTGLPAMTIHRLLGLGLDDTFEHQGDKTIDNGLLIVDEMSMVDTSLASLLLQAVQTGVQVILVGDSHQLPSVRPGQVLSDLLQVNSLPKCQLTRIYRQGEGSTIIQLAHEVNEGEFLPSFTQNFPDRSFILSNMQLMASHIKQVVEKAKNKGYSPQDVQILAPVYRGEAGIDHMNVMMQELFNPKTPKKREVKMADRIFRVGDKVLHLVNDVELNVFNGDMGIITGIILAEETEDNVDTLIIDFDGVEIMYGRSDWHKITLSYCCSIHKSQGSEFPVVILPMVSQYPKKMMQRNLLYTAITRSRDKLIMLGDVSAFEYCVTHTGASRHTDLVQKLRRVFHEEADVEEVLPKQLTKEVILEEKIPAMIGMDGITPYNV